MEENTNNKKSKKGLKVFAYSFLTLLASSALVLSILNVTGVTIRQGEVGVKGEKGETGEKGATGDQGTKGETGDKGATGDQGAKGEKGDTGNAGISGSKGEKGDDADQYYNCTILPSDNGYVTVNKGSVKENEEIVFSFVGKTDSYKISSFKLNGEEKLTDETRFNISSFTTNMPKDGLRVEAKFIEFGAVYDVENSVFYASLDVAINTNNATNIKLYGDTTGNNTITINSDTTIDLNGKNVTFIENKNIEISNGKTLTINDSTNNGSITSQGSSNGSKTVNVLGTLVLNGGSIIHNGYTGGTSGTMVIYVNSSGTLDINGGKVISSNTGNYFSKAIFSSGNSVTIDNATIENKSTHVDSNTFYDGGKAIINNTTFVGYTIFTGTSATYDKELTISKCTFEGKVKLSRFNATIKDNSIFKEDIEITRESGSITSSTFEKNVSFVGGTTSTFKFDKCYIKGNYQKGSTTDNQNALLENCKVDGNVYANTGKVSGLESKFKNKFADAWLATGLKFSDAQDENEYWTLVEDSTSPTP